MADIHCTGDLSARQTTTEPETCLPGRHQLNRGPVSPTVFHRARDRSRLIGRHSVRRKPVSPHISTTPEICLPDRHALTETRLPGRRPLRRPVPFPWLTSNTPLRLPNRRPLSGRLVPSLWQTYITSEICLRKISTMLETRLPRTQPLNRRPPSPRQI